MHFLFVFLDACVYVFMYVCVRMHVCVCVLSVGFLGFSGLVKVLGFLGHPHAYHKVTHFWAHTHNNRNFTRLIDGLWVKYLCGGCWGYLLGLLGKVYIRKC